MPKFNHACPIYFFIKGKYIFSSKIYNVIKDSYSCHACPILSRLTMNSPSHDETQTENRNVKVELVCNLVRVRKHTK